MLLMVDWSDIMKDLKDINILSLQTNRMKEDKTTIALSEALTEQFQNIDISKTLLTNIDDLSENILDELAVEKNIFWYENGLALEAKREIIKNADKVFRYLGTPYAMEQALADYFGGSSIKEWFEYDGLPGHFKVLLDLSKISLNETTFKKAKEITDRVKNKRSKLDVINAYLNQRCDQYVGTVARVGKITTITPSNEVTINVSSNHNMYTGTYVRTVKKITIQGG